MTDIGTIRALVADLRAQLVALDAESVLWSWRTARVHVTAGAATGLADGSRAPFDLDTDEGLAAFCAVVKFEVVP